jgi:integrase
MPSKLLTDRFLARLKPDPARQVDYFDQYRDAKGLVIRVSPSGVRTWCYLYRLPNSRRLRRLKLGEYPTLSLEDARKEVLTRRQAVEVRGEDPAAEKAEWRKVETFSQLTAWYLSEHAKKHKKSWAEDERIINKELLPAWRDRKAPEVTRADVRTLLRKIVERPAPVMANRVLALISRIYTKALEEDVPGVVANPALRLPKPGGEERGRDRVLTDDEIRQLWTVLEDVKRLPRRGAEDEETAAISPMIARGLQVLLLTGQRPGEVFKMRWAHVDLEARWWEMPESATKNRVAHRVPLTKRVVALVEEAKAQGPDGSRWVFAGIKGGSVAARALKASAELARAVDEDGEPLLPFSFHRHDLRRTCATNLAKAGVQRQTISRVLNHVDRGPRATLVYQRYEFDAEKRAALEAWDRRFAVILTGKALTLSARRTQ